MHRHLNVLVPSECQYIALTLRVRPPLENLVALTPQVTHLISNPGTVGLEHQQRCSSDVGNNHFCFLPLCCHLVCLPKKDRFWVRTCKASWCQSLNAAGAECIREPVQGGAEVTNLCMGRAPYCQRCWQCFRRVRKQKTLLKK